MLQYTFIILFLAASIPGKTVSGSVPDDECNNSFLVISGYTNFNSFQYINLMPSEKTIFTINEVTKQTCNETTGFYTIKIPVKNFRGDNAFMYQDFLELLKEKEYPYIEVCILRKDLLDFFSGKDFSKRTININMTGTTKSYLIPCNIVFCEKNKIQIQGEEKIKLSDFNINPPVKFCGLVRVNNIIDITFNFVFFLKNNFP